MINHVNSDIIRHGCVSDQGPKPGKKRKLKCLEDEYFDLGDGYDENDPFIDNTEAVRFFYILLYLSDRVRLHVQYFMVTWSVGAHN